MNDKQVGWFFEGFNVVILVGSPTVRCQEFIDIVETIYRGARKGRGLVMSPKAWWITERWMVNMETNG